MGPHAFLASGTLFGRDRSLSVVSRPESIRQEPAVTVPGASPAIPRQELWVLALTRREGAPPRGQRGGIFCRT